MKTTLVRTIKRNLLFILFLSILVLMLNSFLPVFTIQDSNESMYFNLQNIQYIQNVDIQKLYNDLNLINIIIWALIIFVFIAFFGSMIDISEECQKIGYLFLTMGCSSIIFSSLLCYLYLTFIFKIIGYENISLAYIVEQFRYSYIVLIIFIIILLFSILYIISTLPYIHKSFKDCKEKKKKIVTKEEKHKKSFQKMDQAKTNFNNIEKINMNKFKNKKEGIEDWLSTEIDKLESTESTEKQDFLQDSKIDEPQEEIKDEENKIDNKKMDSSEEKTSPFSQEYIEDLPKPKKDEPTDIKLSESFEKALISAIDKKKGVGEEKKTDNDKTKVSKEEIKKELSKETKEPEKNKQIKTDKLKKEEDTKKYNVKCPACSFIFTTIKNQEGATKIKCPRCGKEGVIK